MDILKAPTPEEFAALELAQAHRFPERGHITVVGDGGAPVRLPIVLANPSGSCKMPSGQTGSPMWSLAAGAMMQFAGVPSADRLSNDCVLWPDAATFQSWVARWPALHERVWSMVRKKVAADTSSFEETAEGEAFPDIIAAAVSQFPHAVVRRFTPQGRSILAVIDSPSMLAWRFFLDAGRKRGAEYWKLISEMSGSCVRVLADEETGHSLSFDDVAARWPGIPVIAAMTVSVLAGMAGESELGEF